MKWGNEREKKSRPDENMVRRIKFFTEFDLLAYREYLEDMSAKGYFFVQRCGFVHTFLVGKPKRRRYYVDLFSESSMVGGGFVNPETAEYITYCRECGWKHLDTDGKIQFFVAEEDDATPIHTDPQLQLSAIRRSMRPWIALCLFIILLGIFNMRNLLDSAWPTELIEMANGGLMYLVAILFVAGMMLRYGFFSLRNHRRAERGEPLQFSSRWAVRYVEWFVLAFMICGIVVFADVILQSSTGIIALMIGTLIMTGLVTYGIYKWYRRREIRAAMKASDDRWNEIYEDVYTQAGDALRTATKKRIVLFVVAVILVVSGIALVGTVEVHNINDGSREGQLEYYDPVNDEHVVEYVSSDAIPLTFEDIGVKNGGILPERGTYVGSDTYANRARSLLGTVLDCYEIGYSDERGADSYIGYNIARCRFDWVRDRVLKEYKNDGYYANHGEFRDVTKEEGKLWNADRVYAAADDESEARLVIRDNTILFIENDRVEYTEDVINDILEALASEV